MVRREADGERGGAGKQNLLVGRAEDAAAADERHCLADLYSTSAPGRSGAGSPALAIMNQRGSGVPFCWRSSRLTAASPNISRISSRSDGRSPWSRSTLAASLAAPPPRPARTPPAAAPTPPGTRRLAARHSRIRRPVAAAGDLPDVDRARLPHEPGRDRLTQDQGGEPAVKLARRRSGWRSRPGPPPAAHRPHPRRRPAGSCRRAR